MLARNLVVSHARHWPRDASTVMLQFLNEAGAIDRASVYSPSKAGGKWFHNVEDDVTALHHQTMSMHAVI